MLSVVIPTHERLSRLRLTLTSVFLQVRDEAVNAEVIVVNDGGCREVMTAVQQVRDQCGGGPTKVVNSSHRGRSAARNLGAAQASADRILFLDADVLLKPGALQAHVNWGMKMPGSLIRGTILHLPWLVAFEDPVKGTLTSQARCSLRVSSDEQVTRLFSRRLTLDRRGCPDGSNLASLARVTGFEKDIHTWLAVRPLGGRGSWIGCTGAQLSVNRKSLQILHGFDEAMGIRWGAEDLELGCRAEKEGIPLIHAFDAVVYHMDHDSSERNGDHAAALTYFSRKHRDIAPLRLLQYFAGLRPLTEVFAA